MVDLLQFKDKDSWLEHRTRLNQVSATSIASVVAGFSKIGEIKEEPKRKELIFDIGNGLEGVISKHTEKELSAILNEDIRTNKDINHNCNAIVFDEHISGSPDGLFDIGDKRILVDFKTRYSPLNEKAFSYYFTQLNIYYNLLSQLNDMLLYESMYIAIVEFTPSPVFRFIKFEPNKELYENYIEIANAIKDGTNNAPTEKVKEDTTKHNFIKVNREGVEYVRGIQERRKEFNKYSKKIDKEWNSLKDELKGKLGIVGEDGNLLVDNSGRMLKIVKEK